VPPPHVSPAAHVTPHAPQLLASLRVSTQTPSHTIPPAEHAQAPLMHSSSAAHITPHAPQFITSTRVLAHTPSHSSPV
jgi:hypothetical protein